MDQLEHEPFILPVWGLTDETCYIAFCRECAWMGPTRSEFEEADDDITRHRARTEVH